MLIQYRVSMKVVKNEKLAKWIVFFFFQFISMSCVSEVVDGRVVWVLPLEQVCSECFEVFPCALFKSLPDTWSFTQEGGNFITNHLCSEHVLLKMCL